MELNNTVDTNIPSKDASGGLVPIGVCINCLFKLLKSDISRQLYIITHSVPIMNIDYSTVWTT